MAIHVLWEDSNFDPRTTALVEGYEGNTLLNQGVILGVDYSDASRVKLSIRSGPRSFLVLADSFYPGWKALVDGKETRIYRTNAVSRGILIEGEGNHQVEFRFFPVSLFVGLTISGVTILAIMFLSFFLGSKPGMSILAPNFPN
jgi:uncharacterized membrane protein YfhO